MKYDVLIVGAGPAGLTAGIFTSRAGLKTIIFEGLAVGGQAGFSADIRNYPGFDSISGFDLTNKMFNQARECGVEFEFAKVEKIKQTKTGFSVSTKSENYFAKRVILAIGCKTRKLGINEENYIGRGVSYCASCDGNFFKNKDVIVVGGGNTAFDNVKYLSRLARSVVMLNRSETFRAGNFRLDELKKIKNVKVYCNAKITALVGQNKLEEVEVQLGKTKTKMKCDGLFVSIGQEPNLDILDFEIETDKFGYVKTDEFQQTSVAGLLACGDIVSKDFRQVITACADGATAGATCIRGLK